MVMSIETEFLEMNLDIDRVFGLFFAQTYALLYRLGLDGNSACFCSSSLNKSPSVPYQYINELPIRARNYNASLMLSKT